MLILLLACTSLPIPGLNNTPTVAPPPAASVVPVSAPPPSAPVATAVATPPATPPVDAAPTVATPAMRTPQTFYAACRERVEEPQSAGECGIDSDCVAVGCSKEVCVSERVAGEIATSCTTQPCFPYLDKCGCHAGVCEWSLKLPEGTLTTLPGPGAPPAGAQ